MFLHPVARGEVPPARVAVSEIVARWGLSAHATRRLGGNRNQHWVVDCTEGQYVLRCYRTDRDLDAIAYEFAVLRHLAAKGWPVACPIVPVQHWKQRLFVMFPRLPGTPNRQRTRRFEAQRERGALLADLHADLAGLALGQRSHWRPLDEFIGAEADSIIDAALRRLQPWPDLRESIVRRTACVQEILHARGEGLPRGIVHGDFVEWNLLWEGSKLTGVIDFDDVRLDLRAADVACARRKGADGVVTGYADASELSGDERVILPTLWRAYTLVFVEHLLRARRFTDQVIDALGWCVTQLENTKGVV